MANPEAQPVENVFDQFDPDKVGDLAQTVPAKKANAFDDLGDVGPGPTSAFGAAAREAVRGALPALGSLPTAAAGAEAGAALGEAVFPAGGGLVGGLVGGLAGAFAGSAAIEKVQDWGLSKLPDSWREALGLSDRQQRIDEGEHPVASFLGGIAPYALTMRPGAAPKIGLPDNATSLQRILAHPAAARLFGGAAMGGMELGQEAASNEDLDWRKVAVATGFGVVFNRPTLLGRRLTSLGVRPVRAALGKEPAVATEAPAEAQAESSVGAESGAEEAPTLAAAADAKVLGPGVTEQVYQGSQTQDPAAATAAAATRRAEMDATSVLVGPDIHVVARQMHPELFARYDDLLIQRDALHAWIEGLGNDDPAARDRLAAIDGELMDAAPEIAAAYRRTADAIGAPTIEPPEPPGVEQQSDFIRDDFAKKLIAAGRPPEEAEAMGAIMAARYETRAALFNGALGSAEELYRREGPDVVGAGRRPVETPEEATVSQGAKGKTFLRQDARTVITLFRSRADASTIVHETGHLFLDEMLRDADHPQAPNQLKDDADAVREWLGVHSTEDIEKRHHEKFARGFEQYLREGVAPSPQLASVFAKFREWLLRIYQSLKGLGKEITPEMRGVFDRLLAVEPRRTVIAPEIARKPTLADIHEADARETAAPEAHGAADRVAAEATRYEADLPASLRAEHAESIERTTERQPGAEAAARPGESGKMAEGGRRPAAEPASGAGSAEPGAELGRSDHAVSEGIRGEGERERPAGASAADAGLGDKPLAPRPGELLTEPDSLNVGKAGNIRVENITSVPEFIRAIDESSKRIVEEHGGADRLTPGEMLDLAEDFSIDPETISEKQLVSIFGGVKNLAAKVWALRTAVKAHAQIVHETAVRFRDSQSDADLVPAILALERQDMLQSVLSSVTTEVGRALGMGFRNMEQMLRASPKGADLDQAVKAATGLTLFQWRSRVMLAATLDTPQKIVKFANDMKKRTFGRMILEYWTNGLISGPTTHVTYMIGNELLALQRAGPETAMAALIGSLRQTMGRGGGRVHMGEVGTQLKEHWRSLPVAVKAALDALHSGVSTLLPGETATNVLPFQTGADFATPSVLNEAARWSDVMASLFGIVRGIKDGILTAGSLAEGQAPRAAWQYSSTGAIPDLQLRGIGTLPIGTAIRLPSRLIAAIHSFQRATVYSMEKAAASYRAAANEGLSGEAFEQRIATLRQNPTVEQMESYVKAATETALMGKGGPVAAALSHLTNVELNLPFLEETQLLKFIDPFVKISSNIIDKTIVERTPLGVLSAEIRADLMGKNGNIAADMALARMATGTLYALGLGFLAAEGYASGSGPTDPRQAAIWRLAGNQAHSVRIGDLWFDVHRLGPVGMLMGIAADLYDVAHLANKGDMLDAAAHLQHAITQNILDESFMRGPSDLIKAVDDPGRYGQAYIRSMLSSFLPYSVGIAQMARASDPYTRQARSVMDAIKQKIPGLSETLLPRRDVWGEPLPSRDALIASGVTAIYETRMSHDPVNLALLNLGIAPAPVERKIRNVELTDDQYDDFQRIAGRMAKMRLDVIVNSPDFRIMPDYLRALVINEVMQQCREAARGVMMMKYPQIPRDATVAQMTRLRAERVPIH